MESTDKDCKTTCDVAQMAVIGKLHNMQWLKSNSKLSGHTKTHLNGREVIVESPLNEGTNDNTEVLSINNVSDSFKLENNDFVTNKDIDVNSIINTNTFHSIVPIVDIPERDMETVWNKDVNVTNTLFPNSPSLVVQRLDEERAMNMNLTQNIVTAQLEQLKLNKGEKSKFSESYNEDENDWNTIDNVLDSEKSDTDVDNQVISKQCHDNNNNNARSKAQPTSEVKKGVQKANAKISTKKLGDQSTRKQAGNSFKESCVISKQGSKDKDDLLDSGNADKTSTPTADSKRLSVGINSRFSDKGGKINGCNRSNTGKGTQMKEQQFYKQHFSTFNDSSSGSRNYSMEGLDEKNKSVAAKLKTSRNDSDRKFNEGDDTKKCHKVQLARVQSYNVQYIRSKPLIKSQQRYLRNPTKPEEENSIKHTSGFNNNGNMSNLTENMLKKKYEDQQTAVNKQISDKQPGKTTLGRNYKDVSVSEYSIKSSSSVTCKKTYQNLSNVKTNSDRDIKDDQGYTQKFKRDTNTYRRSAGTIQMFSKDMNVKIRTDDHKKSVTCSVDARTRSQPESSKIPMYSHKANGASNTNKTDTSDSCAVYNIQSQSSCSNSTKDSTGIDTFTRTLQEPRVLQVSCDETEVQFTKTEQQDASINNSNNKASTSNLEIKSVTFSDNVQEFNMAGHSATSYIENSMQQNKFSTNPFYSNLQSSSSVSDAQQTENYQSVQNSNYFGHNNAQYSNVSANVQNSERDLYLLDIVQQKSEQATPHVSPQNVSPHNNSVIAMRNGLPYQSMPAMYLNQFNNVQTVPSKTADTTIVSHNTLIPSTSSYTVDSQNIMQSEPSSIFMHNTQTSILSPPGFHNHPVSTQHNQWNLPLPDMFLYGNVMNPAPLNMQIPNSRHLCNTEFNNIQQAGYLQHPLYYVPQLCMQNWNPLLQYPTPLFQNPPYTNCSTFPSQPLPPNSLTDSVNCSASTSAQNNPYKQFQQVQQLENSPNYSVPLKLDGYAGNAQAGKLSNVRMKDNTMNMRANQYRNPVSEYQNCSQDAQLMVPFSYAVAMDSIARNVSSSMHVQMNQKYAPRALNTANYQSMHETCSFQNNQDARNRKDDGSKTDSECIPPMVSPRDCMYYGVSYSRKPDTVQNSSLRSTKPMAYMQSVHSQHYPPQHQKHTTYQTSPKEFASKMTIGRGGTRMMEQ